MTPSLHKCWHCLRQRAAATRLRVPEEEEEAAEVLVTEVDTSCFPPVENLEDGDNSDSQEDRSADELSDECEGSNPALSTDCATDILLKYGLEAAQPTKQDNGLNESGRFGRVAISTNLKNTELPCEKDGPIDLTQSDIQLKTSFNDSLNCSMQSPVHNDIAQGGTLSPTISSGRKVKNRKVRRADLENVGLNSDMSDGKLVKTCTTDNGNSSLELHWLLSGDHNEPSSSTSRPIKQPSIHWTPQTYACSECGVMFASNFFLKQHLLGHDGVKKFACEICGVKFARKTSLSTHANVHAEKKFQCNICGTKFTQKCSLKKHSVIHTGELPYPCTLCDAKFRYYTSLSCHLKMHSGERSFQCTVCDAKFLNNCSLKSHYAMHTKDRHYQCESCPLSFADRSSLTRHKLIHDPDNYVVCAICGSKFPYKHALARHMRTHTGDRPFKCTVCNKSFFTKSNFNSHMLRHSTKGKCLICHETFVREETFKKHMAGHPAVKPFQCSYCEQRFWRKAHLKHHVLQHLDNTLVC
uniref:C2H2-type domain-containing protein n=1 Tax=Timema cristinae TaxID=61476 RepID=A0A7R9CNM6_TIMCR|nr:unnamed protein product [Timema cristinae]